MMNNISIVRNHVEVVQATSLSKVFQAITDPQSKYKDTIEEIRQLYKLGSSEEANKLKKTLIAFTTSGIFNKKRTTKNLESYSGMLILDLDDLNPRRLQEVMEIVKALPYTHMAFISPSGFGLKIIVKVSSEKQYHKVAYQQVMRYYTEETGEKFDNTCDVARLCYISYDLEAYFNEISAIFQVDLAGKSNALGITANDKNEIELTVKQLEKAYEAAKKYTDRTQKFEIGNRNVYLHRLSCNANLYGVGLPYMLEKCWEDYAEGWDENEIKTTVTRTYNTNAGVFGKWNKLLATENLKFKNNDESSDDQDNCKDDEDYAEKTPTIPVDIITRMPSVLRKIASILSSDRERDTFITGALTVLSGCLYSVEGIYDGNIVFPNLFSFIIAPPSSGKGVLQVAKDLGTDLHEKLLKDSELANQNYEMELQRYNDARRDGNRDIERPEKPPFIMLYIPGNSSSAAIYEHLKDCSGIGIVCETEADTVNNCLKNDWGSYSDLLRKAYHHEHISSRRKKDREYIEVKQPRLSVSLSGTGSQLKGLIPSAEDGLFSRFIFYRFTVARKWRDVSPANGKGDLPSIKKLVSKEVTSMVEFLIKHPTQFDLSERQWQSLNNQFSNWLNDVACFVTEEAAATVMRLGLTAFRIAMTLSAIQKFEQKSKEQKITCTDENFEVALKLVNIYLQHALVMYKELPTNARALDGKIKKFYTALPHQCDRKMAIALALDGGLNITVRTVDKYLKKLVTYGYLEKSDYNEYRKVFDNTEDNNDNAGSDSPVIDLSACTIANAA